MPSLEFKGKQHVYAHHLTVPYRPLTPDQDKSAGDANGADDNLIIHGDNLHALKALLPRYAGRVKCIYIDPPYNTGNEGWVYNDNVNSPLHKEWFKQNSPVDGEDLERHDKWLCMMWPRLQLLRELLSDDGAIFISIDDNEQHHLRMLMDEIFGVHNFVTTVIWHKMDSPKNTALHISEDHESLQIYARNADVWRSNLLPRSDEMLARYKNPDDDPRGPWLLSDLAARNRYSRGRYSITTPSGNVIQGPPAGSYWRVSKEKFNELDSDNRIWWGKSGSNRPGIKRFLSEVREGVVARSLWEWQEVGSTRHSKQELSEVMAAPASSDLFVTPKPTGLVKRVLQIATDRDSLVLDSFAGSGTTAHAVLALNKEDGGNRKFILAECEDYADSLTAERVRHVIAGVPDAKDDALREGLGGSFTYCALGEPITVEGLLTGETLPPFASLAAWLLHTATGVSASTSALSPLDDYGLFYTDERRRYYLLYEPDLEFLRSDRAVLNEEGARRIGQDCREHDKEAMVFAAAKYMGQRELSEHRITFCQLPYELQRRG